MASPGGDAAAAQWRLRDPPVIGRIQKGRLLLDLRTVLPEQDDVLADRLAASIEGPAPSAVPGTAAAARIPLTVVQGHRIQGAESCAECSTFGQEDSMSKRPRFLISAVLGLVIVVGALALAMPTPSYAGGGVYFGLPGGKFMPPEVCWFCEPADPGCWLIGCFPATGVCRYGCLVKS